MFQAPQIRRRLALCVLLCGALGRATASEPDEPPAPNDQHADQHSDPFIERLIEQLNDDRFASRQQAYHALLDLGDASLPQLAAAVRNGSREQAARARQLIDTLRERPLFLAFRRLGSLDDGEIDLEEGMWLISRILNPDVKLDDLKRGLDELAGRVRERLGPEFSGRKADPQTSVEVLLRVLFTELNFAGNTENYYHPSNSSLETVLATRRGLPILLSQVVVSVAQRLDLPIVGIAIPGRYMAKYDGSRAPAGLLSNDIVIDAFTGRIVETDELDHVIPGFDADEHLKPATRRATLVRMLTNLIDALTRAGDTQRAVQARRYQRAIEAGGELPLP